MSKKDCELLAKVIRECRENATTDHLAWFAVRLADELKRENERFDRVRFLDACSIY